MKYLVTYSGLAGEEKVFCDENEITDLIETKLREGSSENDIEVYSVEPVPFQVERVPQVTLSNDSADTGQAQESQTEPVGSSFDSPLSLDEEPDSDPVADAFSEPVFSLDN